MTVPTNETPVDGTQEPAQGSVEEIDWKEASRKWEARSKENRTALDAALEKANKAEALEAQLNAINEEAGTKEAAANAALEKAQLDIIRLKIANKHGLSEDEQDLFLTASDEETLNRQAEAIANRTSKVQPNGAQGKRVEGPASNREAFARLFEEELQK